MNFSKKQGLLLLCLASALGSVKPSEKLNPTQVSLDAKGIDYIITQIPAGKQRWDYIVNFGDRIESHIGQTSYPQDLLEKERDFFRYLVQRDFNAGVNTQAIHTATSRIFEGMVRRITRETLANIMYL